MPLRHHPPRPIDHGEHHGRRKRPILTPAGMPLPSEGGGGGRSGGVPPASRTESKCTGPSAPLVAISSTPRTRGAARVDKLRREKELLGRRAYTLDDSLQWRKAASKRRGTGCASRRPVW